MIPIASCACYKLANNKKKLLHKVVLCVCWSLLVEIGKRETPDTDGLAALRLIAHYEAGVCLKYGLMSCQ